MKEALKKVVCEMMCGFGDCKCENCIKYYQEDCNRYVRKLMIAIHKNKENLDD